MQHLITRGNRQATEIEKVGAKACNLFLLQEQGYNVPALFAVPVAVFKSYIHSEILEKDILQIRGYIKNVKFRQDFIDELQQHTDKSRRYVVRSSAIAEDSDQHSFAGQLDSFLNVSVPQITDNIKKVWLSYFSDQAVEYRRINNLLDDLPKIAVIIQEMIDSEISGVSFAINPVTGQRNEIVISSVYGLGEGLVSGELNADVFKVHGTSISKEIADKQKALVFNKETSAVETHNVRDNLQKEASLSDEQVFQIAAVTKEISAFYGKAQDIEWTIASTELFILQSRPVTTLGQLPDKDQQRRLWDNSNIIESYPGITTPLTFSFVKDVYTHVYQQFCRIMGVEEKLIQKNSIIFDMLGFIKGRIYYNLHNWYKVLSLLPGYSINASFMEQMMGVTEKIEYQDTVVKSTKNKYLRLFRLIIMLLFRFVGLNRQVRAFHKLIDETLQSCSNDILKQLSPDQLVERYQYLENKLLSHWNTPLVNDFFAMIFFGLLKKSVEKNLKESHASLYNDLISAEGGIISVGPIRSLQKMSNTILNSAELSMLFNEGSTDTIRKKIADFPEFKKDFEHHVSMFGDRVAGELKLESVTAKQDPGLIINLLKSYIKNGLTDVAALESAEKEKRKQAEAEISKNIGFNPFKRIVFKFLLNKTRMTIRNRENLRFERTRVFAVVRNIFRHMGKYFYRESVLDHPADIFYLTREEIFRFINGSAVDDNLKHLVATRKEIFAGYKDISLPDRFESWGPLYHANSYDKAEKNRAADGAILQGMGCSPGQVSGKVVIVEDPTMAGDLKGNIMVAEKTDPGWAPLFPLAAGLLVQRGSLLSHSAIVAREMRIPAIVAIPDLLNRLKTGDKVRFDGSTGEVEIIKDDDE